MKTNTTQNLASAAMIVVLSPILILAAIVSVRNEGVVGNDMLLLLLTLTGAVLTGINGFGRRTTQSPAMTQPVKSESGNNSHKSITWSSRHRTNA
jgi:hypothetical protein